MQADYPYFYTKQSQDVLSIDDIGDCAIEICNDDGEFFFLFIRTDLGVTRVFQYGPYVYGGYPTSVKANFDQFDYNEKKIDKLIDKFVNNPSWNITQARILDVEEYQEILQGLPILRKLYM